MSAGHADRMLRCGMAVALCWFACGLLFGSQGRAPERRDIVELRGAARVENLEVVSFSEELPEGRLRARPGQVLRVKVSRCDCPAKNRTWYYQYRGAEKQPLTSSENAWSLHVGEKDAERVVGLNLACAEARQWLQEAPGNCLKDVNTAYVDRDAIETGAIRLLPSVRTAVCDPEIGQDALASLCAIQPELVALSCSYLPLATNCIHQGQPTRQWTSGRFRV